MNSYDDCLKKHSKEKRGWTDFGFQGDLIWGS